MKENEKCFECTWVKVNEKWKPGFILYATTQKKYITKYRNWKIYKVLHRNGVNPPIRSRRIQHTKKKRHTRTPSILRINKKFGLRLNHSSRNVNLWRWCWYTLFIPLFRCCCLLLPCTILCHSAYTLKTIEKKFQPPSASPLCVCTMLCSVSEHVK